MSALFVWVAEDGIWQPGKLKPVIIHDIGMVAYLEKEKHIRIVKRYEITDDDAKLGIKVLALRYPAPAEEETK